MQATAQAFIETLNGALAPLCSTAKRFDPQSALTTKYSFALSHRPAIAPEAYALRLFVPLPAASLANYLSTNGLVVPAEYRQILLQLNGAQAFQLALYGVPPSLLLQPPVLDRTEPQPLDLATANTSWRRAYRATADWFHFGGAPHSDDANVGYFLEQSGQIHAILKTGVKVGHWPSFPQFLLNELARVEAEYPRFEASMARRRTHPPAQRHSGPQ